MRPSRRDAFTISDDLVLGIPEDGSSDGCSVGSLESIEAPGYSPFTSDDNASGRELEMESPWMEYTDLCMDRTGNTLETMMEGSNASESVTVTSQLSSTAPGLVAQIGLPIGTNMSHSLTTASKLHGNSSPAPGLVAQTGLPIGTNMSRSLMTTSQFHGNSSTTPGLIAQTGLPIGTNMSHSLMTASQLNGNSSTAPGLVAQTGLPIGTNMSHSLMTTSQLHGDSSTVDTVSGSVSMTALSSSVSSSYTAGLMAASETTTTISNYKLLGDNIDLSIKSRFMKMEDHRNSSYHFFHCCAVQDRVNLSHLSCEKADSCLNSFSNMALEILPSIESDSELINNVAVIVSRVLATHMQFFSITLGDVVTWHIEHEYYEDMKKKSEVVSNY